ncbi:uncharacterized protein LOC141588319 [Silene latifolia]|uniref:uncharacterized protein LOC141588319 n=1 Tax=Silene latifolia TaxID=37657 RepID=UPI003D77DB92
MLVQSKVDNKKFLLTVIYAFNDLMERTILWKFLKDTASTCSLPWLWVGDFNTVLSPIERLGGNTTDAEMEHFQECVSLCEMEDIKATGALFTWSNKQAPSDRVYSRLDRAMGNPEWMSHYGEYMAHFHPEGMFDHCPCTIVDRKVEFNGKKSFKYFNMWGSLEYFKGYLWKINATTITLIPKLDRPTSVKHFRPISCCNVLYKAISKIMCNRLAAILPDIISKNQGAFVKGRSILENILICQDLVRLYNRSMVSPRCLFKLDLQKAYDSIEWQFVAQMMDALNFPSKFKNWVMCCISSPTYSLSLNGAQFGYFEGKRGLRQGDPISPLIFCVCMEYLSRVLDYATNRWYFRYHPLCKSLKLTHLLFADDLLMFCKGDQTSLKLDIIQVSGFQEGSLPFKYLGIPVQAVRLKRSDCKVLIEKIVCRIRGLGARKLSYAGRLILINSVLNTLHNYWASIFLIPKGVISRIEMICRNFLWTGDAEYHRVPLVAWQKVCCSKKEGGLGVKDARVWNIATVGKLVNWIYTKADRLWVLWVDHVYMKGTDWNSYQPPPDSNWNWRNICKVRTMLATGFQGNQWLASSSGYTVTAGYQWMQGTHPPVHWYKDVWDGWAIPKHSLIGWLIKHEALNTRVKLFSLGLCNTNRCVLCEKDEERHSHLFGSCDYSSKVAAVLGDWLHINLSTVTGISKTQKKVYRVIRLACWYAVWMERNSCRVDLKLRRPDIVAAEIKATVKARLIQVVTRPVLVGDKEWLESLGLII